MKDILRTAVRAATIAVCALCLSFPPAPASAQVPGEEEAELRREQAELFRSMFDAPDDIRLMFEYALLSVRLQDYEAAITTLERILIYNDSLPRVHLELGAAYFRIGANPVAKIYFRRVLENDEAGADLRQRASEFIASIDQRAQTSYFTGMIGLSGIFTTNANNGPRSAQIEFLGIPAVLTDPNAVEQDDFGARVTVQGTHFYDLGGPSEDQWRSDAAISTTRFLDTSEGAVDVFFLRTGPRLSLDADRYGPKAQPFAEVTHFRFGDDALQSQFAVGVALSDTIDQSTSIFSDVSVGYRDDYQTSALSDKDGIFARSRAGFNYFHDKSLTLRGFARAEYEDAQSAPDENFLIGASVQALWRYDSGFGFASRRWLVNASANADFRIFSAPGIFNPTKDREDLDLRFSLSHTAYLDNGFDLTAQVSYLRRESNIRTFDLENLTVSLGTELRF